MTMPADAAIIITEGKISKSTTTKRIRRAAVSQGAVANPVSATNPDAVLDGSTEDDQKLEEDEDGIGDLDQPDPEGWDCQDIGGGVEYCEPEEDEDANEGSSTGAGGGGGLGDDTDVVFAGEPELAGCQGAGGSSSAFLWLVGALLLVARRRTHLA